MNLISHLLGPKKNSFEIVSDFLWNHKEVIMGCAVGAGALYAINKYRKMKRPEHPLLNIQTSLNCAKLVLSMLERMRIPPNVTLVFCIDTSYSMSTKYSSKENLNWSRLDTVIDSMKKIFTNAQKLVDERNGIFEIAVVGFDTKAKVIAPATKLVPTDEGKNPVLTDLINNLEKLKPMGNTIIRRGLRKATEFVEEMAKKNPKAKHTLILLTDGDENLKNDISSIQSRLASVNSYLYAIGIGEGHRAETLMKITQSKNKKFKATYIDTTNGKDTIESAIFNIYQQTIARFSNLELTSPLPAGTWSLGKKFSVKSERGSSVSLKGLQENQPLTKVIKIHPQKLTAPLDLSTVSFKLRFIDPKGLPGELSWRWKANNIIDPKIAC